MRREYAKKNNEEKSYEDEKSTISTAEKQVHRAAQKKARKTNGASAPLNKKGKGDAAARRRLTQISCPLSLPVRSDWFLLFAIRKRRSQR